MGTTKRYQKNWNEEELIANYQRSQKWIRREVINMSYHQVWYYFTDDIEGKMHSMIVEDEQLGIYLHNNPYETGIEVFEIKPTTEQEYLNQYK